MLEKEGEESVVLIGNAEHGQTVVLGSAKGKEFVKENNWIEKEFKKVIGA